MGPWPTPGAKTVPARSRIPGAAAGRPGGTLCFATRPRSAGGPAEESGKVLDRVWRLSMKRRVRKVVPTVALLVSLGPLGHPGLAQGPSAIKRGLVPSDYAYELSPGVKTREVEFYSDGVACWGKVFYPRGFTPEGQWPGVVLAHGWTGTHPSLEQYAARFADRGLVAMVIDYRGWGNSDGFVTLQEDLPNDDGKRISDVTAKVRIKRTRLLPMKQVEDYRNAISYLQGEPGVDRDRIGIWGSSYSGGHIVTVSALDARVKAAVGQVPAVSGKNVPRTPRPLSDALLEDAIARARTGQGGEFETGFSTPRMVDVETRQASSEYHPFHYVERVPETTAILFIGAGEEELYGPRKNLDRGVAAAQELKGPSKYMEVPGVTHFEIYVGEAFEQSANAAADWFLEHLGSGRSE